MITMTPVLWSVIALGAVGVLLYHTSTGKANVAVLWCLALWLLLLTFAHG